MYQARREAGRLFGRCEHASLKVRPRTARGPLLSKAPSTLERMSILAAAFRTSTALGVGINVALTRWIRRVAFVGGVLRTTSWTASLITLVWSASAIPRLPVLARTGRG